MTRIGAHLPAGTGRRIIRWALCSVALTVFLAACGSSSSKSGTQSTTAAAAATGTSPTTSQSTESTTSTTATAKHPAKRTKPSHAHHATKTTSSGGASPSGGGTSTTHTTHTSSTPAHTTSTHSSSPPAHTSSTTTTSPPRPKPKPKPSTPKPAALPRPVVSGSSGGLHASLHGQNHAPVAGKLWEYMVLATDASGRALRGTVETEFAFNGTVVGRQSPPTLPLKNGRLDYKVTFPARSVGIPLDLRIVVRTSAGTVTLNWPVKSRH